MRALSSADFLDMWERGAGLHPVDRSLVVLHSALPETYEDLADWPLGRRNQALAELRCACFGPQLEGWTACPRCGEKLEFQMDAGALAATGSRVDGPITVNGQSFRLPTSRDLARAARETDPHLGAVRLMEACRLGDGEAPAWPDQEIDKVGEQMALADPMAEIRLTLNCAACSNQWDETLDIASFLWTEIASRAKRLLREVHTIASAYGWTEREILSLSQARRSFYLEMAEA
jgi:hypothetical protein